MKLMVRWFETFQNKPEIEQRQDYSNIYFLIKQKQTVPKLNLLDPILQLDSKCFEKIKIKYLTVLIHGAMKKIGYAKIWIVIADLHVYTAKEWQLEP